MTRLLPLAVCSLLMLSASAFSRPLDKIRKDALVVGIRSGDLPFGYSSVSGKEGLEHDLAAALSQGLGVRFQVVEIASQKEGEEKLLADKIDILLGRVKSVPGLRERFLATIPYFRSGLGILALKSNRSIFTLTDLDGRPVAATSGTDADRLIDDFVPKAKLELVRTSQEGLSLLRSGAVEAFIHDRSALQTEAAKDPSLRVLDVTLTEDDYVILVGRKYASLQTALNVQLARLRSISSSEAQSGLAALCARYKLDPGIKPVVVRSANASAASAPTSASATGFASPDLAHRLDAIERDLRGIQQTLSHIDSLLEARDAGR